MAIAEAMARASEGGSKHKLCPLSHSHRGSDHKQRTPLALLHMLQSQCRTLLKEEIRKRCGAMDGHKKKASAFGSEYDDWTR